MQLTRGSNRELVATADLANLRRAGALVEDTRRERPRWFDGRFLAARDLIREQNYFLTREADLGRAAGSGVAVGLEVREHGASGLRISAGHGITPSGDLVMLERGLDLALSDIPRVEQLSGKFGLGRLPVAPLRSRSGLFALALRPVEFTANPVGAYPTSITGARKVEDGDIVEATAVVLVPWPDDGGDASLQRRRGRAAHAIFVHEAGRGLSANLLPIAMLALDHNSVAWIDAPMLRRVLGADRDDLPGLGLASRALRQAHLLQHQQHLADVLADTGGRPFAAASMFSALPPAGPLPAGVIDPRDFTQRYFPASIDVEFSIIPEDELPALVEESLALPGFDLGADDDALESSAVLVLAPVPRSQWRAVLSRLSSVRRSLRPAAPNQIAARKPLEILQRLRVREPLVAPLDPASPADAEWQRLARLDTLWFVRRRNLAYREDLAGSALRIGGREVATDGLRARLNELGLGTRFDSLLARATPSSRPEIENLLNSERIASSPTLTAATLGEFSREVTLDQAAALRVESAVTDASVGRGFTRLDETALARDPQALEAVASNPEWRTVDSQAAVAAQPTLTAAPDTSRTSPTRPTVRRPIRPT